MDPIKELTDKATTIKDDVENAAIDLVYLAQRFYNDDALTNVKKVHHHRTTANIEVGEI